MMDTYISLALLSNFHFIRTQNKTQGTSFNLHDLNKNLYTLTGFRDKHQCFTSIARPLPATAGSHGSFAVGIQASTVVHTLGKQKFFQYLLCISQQFSNVIRV